jgi:hypothetical protein
VRRHRRELQEAVEPQVALAEHRRRSEIENRLLIEPLRDRRAGAHAIEIDGDRANPRALQFGDPLGRAHQAGDVELRLQALRETLADVAAARDQDVAAAHAGDSSI